MKRPHGEINFYLCQFLTGHGYFRAYLHKMGKIRSPQCLYCGADRDDAYHSFFDCNHLTEERNALISIVGKVTPDNIIGVMLQSEDKGDAVAGYVETVLRKKKNESCLDVREE